MQWWLYSSQQLIVYSTLVSFLTVFEKILVTYMDENESFVTGSSAKR